MRFVRTATKPGILTQDQVEKLVIELAKVCTAAPVLLMYLHGTHANGTQTHLSDIDIAVLLETHAARDLLIHADLLASLQATCGREDVDLAILNVVGPILKDRVVRHGRLIFARSPRDRVLFEAAAIKEALDFRTFSRVWDGALFRQLREGRFLG
ncbi:MAG: nucleotidyltransferase domain-containing protein [Planctomycetota bacterium]